MKQKDIHVVFGRSAKGTFIASQEFDLNEIQLICLEDNLNIGPICDLYSSEDIVKRKEWESKLFGDTPDLNPIEGDIEAIKSIVESPRKMGNIFLWTGCYANEIINTARLLYHLSQHEKSVFIVDFANVAVKRQIDGMTIYPRTLSATAPFQVKEVLNHFKLINENQLLKWESIWEDMLTRDTMLRVLGEDGEIHHKNETYLDTFLELNCKDEFQGAAWVIGRTLCDIDFAVGDGYLNWRLKQLSLKGKIETRGKLKEIRDYEVRKI